MPPTTESNGGDPDWDLAAAIMQDRDRLDRHAELIASLRADLDEQAEAAEAGRDLARTMRKTCDAFADALDEYENALNRSAPSRGA